MSRPSDAAIAAAFWEFRKSQDEMPHCFLGVEEAYAAKFGNAVVQRARYLDSFIHDAKPEQAEAADA